MSTALTQFPSNLSSLVGDVNAGPAWAQAWRREAARQFSELGVPTTKNEEWKYTHLRDFAEVQWQPGAPVVEADYSDRYLSGDRAIQVLIVNGRFVGVKGQVPAGVTITELSLESPMAEKYLGKATGKSTTATTRTIEQDAFPFGALNTAQFESGLLIHLSAGAVCEPTIEVLQVLHAQDSPLVVFPRTLIVAEANSQAKIVESYVTGVCHPSASIPVTEVFVEDGANLEHVRVQDQCKCSTHIGLWQTSQAKDSTYTSFNIAYGGKLGRLDQTIWIGGESCTTRLDGVVCARSEQHIDNHTRLDHALPNCNSYEIYKQIIADKATAVFNGKIFVHEDAQKTDAKQTNQALLLSPDATINSKPQLEIFADDVKCTHGATVGQLEDLPMFYMRSRGVSKEQAQAVLVYAFAAEVLELITIEPVRTALERRLYEMLGVDLG